MTPEELDAKQRESRDAVAASVARVRAWLHESRVKFWVAIQEVDDAPVAAALELLSARIERLEVEQLAAADVFVASVPK